MAKIGSGGGGNPQNMKPEDARAAADAKRSEVSSLKRKINTGKGKVKTLKSVATQAKTQGISDKKTSQQKEASAQQQQTISAVEITIAVAFLGTGIGAPKAAQHFSLASVAQGKAIADEGAAAAAAVTGDENLAKFADKMKESSGQIKTNKEVVGAFNKSMAVMNMMNTVAAMDPTIGLGALGTKGMIDDLNTVSDGKLNKEFERLGDKDSAFIKAGIGAALGDETFAAQQLAVAGIESTGYFESENLGGMVDMVAGLATGNQSLATKGLIENTAFAFFTVFEDDPEKAQRRSRMIGNAAGIGAMATSGGADSQFNEASAKAVMFNDLLEDTGVEIGEKGRGAALGVSALAGFGNMTSGGNNQNALVLRALAQRVAAGNARKNIDPNNPNEQLLYTPMEMMNISQRFSDNFLAPKNNDKLNAVNPFTNGLFDGVGKVARADVPSAADSAVSHIQDRIQGIAPGDDTGKTNAMSSA